MAGPSPYIASNNRAFFNKLKKEVQDIVAEKAEYRAENILNGLRFRRNLLGENGGRWPIWEGTVSPQRTDDHSFRDWKMTKKGPADYVISNSHENSVDGFKYPRLLFYGVPTGSNHVWAKSVANGTSERLTVTGGKIFSSQLPRGLVPYVIRQDKLLQEDIRQIASEYNKRHR